MTLCRTVIRKLDLISGPGNCRTKGLSAILSNEAVIPLSFYEEGAPQPRLAFRIMSKSQKAASLLKMNEIYDLPYSPAFIA